MGLFFLFLLGLVWWLLRSSGIRADASGIGYSAGFWRHFVLWDQVATYNVEKRMGHNAPVMCVVLRDSKANELLAFKRDYGSRQDSERLIKFIEAKLAQKEIDRST